MCKMIIIDLKEMENDFLELLKDRESHNYFLKISEQKYKQEKKIKKLKKRIKELESKLNKKEIKPPKSIMVTQNGVVIKDK